MIKVDASSVSVFDIDCDYWILFLQLKHHSRNDTTEFREFYAIIELYLPFHLFFCTTKTNKQFERPKLNANILWTFHSKGKDAVVKTENVLMWICLSSLALLRKKKLKKNAFQCNKIDQKRVNCNRNYKKTTSVWGALIFFSV